MDTCDIQVRCITDNKYQAYCMTHDADGLNTHRTARLATHMFMCDKGENLRFLMATDEEGVVPSFHDLGQTVYYLRDAIEHNDNWCTVYRIAHKAPAELELRECRVKLIHKGEWGEEGRRCSLWHLLDDHGQIISEIYSVEDGNA